jgi:hypothetical protein
MNFCIDHGSVTGVDETLNWVEMTLLGVSVALKREPEPSSLADEDALAASVAEEPTVDSNVGPVPERLGRVLLPSQIWEMVAETDTETAVVTEGRVPAGLLVGFVELALYSAEVEEKGEILVDLVEKVPLAELLGCIDALLLEDTTLDSRLRLKDESKASNALLVDTVGAYEVKLATLLRVLPVRDSVLVMVSVVVVVRFDEADVRVVS